MAETLAPLTRWENFYVIVGSSAGALTGLQFVVITLIAEAQRPSSMREVSAFGTPTVVHFCAALLVSAIVSAPWPSLWSAAIAIGVCGLLGLAYAVRVIIHAKRQKGYRPHAEDWTFYIVLPLITYGALVLAGLMLVRGPIGAMFLIGAIALVLLFLGIRNAWDTVTYIAIAGGHSRDQAQNNRDDAAA